MGSSSIIIIIIMITTIINLTLYFLCLDLANGLVARSGEKVNGTLRLPRAWIAISSGEGLGVSSASDKFTVQLTLSVMSVGWVEI